MTYLIALLIALTFLIVGIVRFKIHPFFVLLAASLIYGFIAGMDPSLIVASINTGFGGILGKIGLIILFGVVIGTILEKSGGAMVIATRVLQAIGEKSIHLAMLLTGYILSIPVFADSALLMMNSLNKVMSKKANVSYAGTTAALAMGLTASHVMVPPTPGPIAAAGILGANLGNVILWGLLVSSLSLIPCYFYATKVASKINLPIKIEPVSNPGQKPKLWKSLLAIVIPLILILLKAVLEYPELKLDASSFLFTIIHALKLPVIISFLGTPMIALLIGVLLALLLPEKLDEKIFSSSGWIGESLKIAAPILLITGAGGIFGKMLQNSDLAETVSGGFVSLEMGLLFPFLLAACLKTTQGSSTVALVTTASIVAPVMTPLALDTPFLQVMTVLSIGAGSSVASHVNDSFFWVLTQLTGMKVKQGYQVQTAGTFIFGVSAMTIILIITQLLFP
ncbi:GntP family permease [Marinoscillum furvescens]|uniref:Putative D-glycerate permease n=1 Tax=Marinoscillum furvescens DSM 4134 TaxID=1122208 RepID=A0A3D9L782_MARFU|nr:GntP family permease [Marinoscillum furvescens]REE00193.1 putative D-glycerate permease [Marinoscillum furvescens DSM 4134]